MQANVKKIVENSTDVNVRDLYFNYFAAHGGSKFKHKRHSIQRAIISQTARDGSKKAPVPTLFHHGHHRSQHSAIHNSSTCYLLRIQTAT